MTKCKLFVILALLPVFLITSAAFSRQETIITDSGKLFSPRQYANINFQEEMGRDDPGLEDLGTTIDRGFIYCDVKALTQAAVILGYIEKEWGTKPASISTAQLLNKAEYIARFRRSPEEMRSVANAYNERSMAFNDPDKAMKLEQLANQYQASPSGMQTAELVVYNQTRQNDIFIYVNQVYIGKVRPRARGYFRQIPAGKITLTANDGTQVEWGPRTVYLGRGDVFNWKLYSSFSSKNENVEIIAENR